MNRLKELRLEKHMSQAKLAEVFNISQQAVSHYEKGLRDMDSNLVTSIIIRNFKNRDKKDYSEDLVNKFQDKEISYSKIIAKSLNIDIQIIKLSDFN
ncbi:hypothetical protein GCM10008907_31180 [Clostridium sartagoforme]